MSEQVTVKIRIEDADVEQAVEVFRIVEDLLDEVAPLSAEGLRGQGDMDGAKYSYTVTPVGGEAQAEETAAGCVREHGPEVCCGESCTTESFVEADAAAWAAAHPNAGEVLMLLGRLVERIRILRQLGERELPCGHKIADLIGGAGAVMRCGACLREHPKRPPTLFTSRFLATARSAGDGTLLLRPDTAPAKLLVEDIRSAGVVEVLCGLAPEPTAARSPIVDQSPPKRIRAAEDFVDILGDAIEGGKLPGVLGIDDVGTTGDGARLLALLLNDDEGTRIPITVLPARAGEEVPRG